MHTDNALSLQMVDLPLPGSINESWSANVTFFLLERRRALTTTRTKRVMTHPIKKPSIAMAQSLPRPSPTATMSIKGNTTQRKTVGREGHGDLGPVLPAARCSFAGMARSWGRDGEASNGHLQSKKIHLMTSHTVGLPLGKGMSC